jgi:ribonuclease HI
MGPRPPAESGRPQVVIYTDGACKGNPGPGGWGAWVSSGSHEKELFGGDPQTTNQRMELTAAVQALATLTKPCAVVLYTDSMYLLDGITKWINAWRRNGWRNSAKQPVKNADLWRELDEAATRHAVEWRWVKGHSGDLGNERADALANGGAALFITDPR